MRENDEISNLKKKIAKFAFFEKSIFRIFWVAKKSKNRIIKNVKSDQTTPNFYRGIRKKGVKHHFWII